MTNRPQFLRCRLIAVALGCAAGTAGVANAADSEDGRTTVITCTNPVGGASWQIVVDRGNGTVDGYPARIGPKSISWFDRQDGGHYTLDLVSGDLAGSVASSTGGYSRRAHCDLGASR